MAPLITTEPSPRVLVVGDDLDTVETTAVLFRMHGAQVEKAYSGRMAIEAARALCPDLILLDLVMPQVSGYEVALALQDSPLPNRPLLVGVSDQSGDEVLCAEAGFDLHLKKPVEFAVFERLLLLLRETHALTEHARQLTLSQWVKLRDLLLAHVQMAATFLKVARTTGDSETRERCLAKAKKAREDVAKHLQRAPRTMALSPLDLVLEDALDKALALQRTTMGYIQLSDQRGSLKIVVQRGFRAEVLQDFLAMRKGHADNGRGALLDTATVAIEDVEADERFAAGRRFASRARFRAVTSTPLIAGRERLLGILSTHFPEPRHFAGPELEAFEHCARDSAILISWASDS